MRKFAGFAAVAALAVLNSGCVVAMGNRGTSRGITHRQAVALEGNIYVVDVATGDVKKIDRSRIETAAQFASPTQQTVTVEVEED